MVGSEQGGTGAGGGSEALAIDCHPAVLLSELFWEQSEPIQQPAGLSQLVAPAGHHCQMSWFWAHAAWALQRIEVSGTVNVNPVRFRVRRSRRPQRMQRVQGRARKNHNARMQL